MALVLPDERLIYPELLHPGRKPTFPVKVDWSHPLAADLKHALIYAPSGLYDLAEQRIPASEMSIGDHAGGYGLIGDGTEKTLTLSNSISAAPLTVISCIVLDAAPSGDEEVIAGKLNATSTDREWLFRVEQTRELRWYEFNSSGGNTGYKTSEQLPIGEAVTVGASYFYDTSSYTRLYINGTNKSTAITGVGTPIQTPSKTMPIRIGTCDTIDDALNGAYIYTFIWARSLSDANHRSISINPYQFLIPR